MGQHEPIRAAANVSSAEIPDKLYFRIGEVAELCQVPAYVLRFWESEFPQLKPNKGGTGQRLFRRRDVEIALRIKRLLYDEGHTIAGARLVFKTEGKQRADAPVLALATPGSLPDPRKLAALRRELQDIAALLARPAGKASPPSAVRLIRRPRRAQSTEPVEPKHTGQPTESTQPYGQREALFVFTPMANQSDSEV